MALPKTVSDREYQKFVDVGTGATAVRVVASGGLTNTTGKVYYVDSSISASGSGGSWAAAFKTITEAIAVASTNDVIYLAPGDYDEGALVTITQSGLKIIGSNPTSNGYPTLWMASAADHILLKVKANNVEISNIGFVQTNAKVTIAIGDTPGQAYYKLFIHGCKFDGWGTSTYAISAGNSTAAANDQVDAPDIHVDDCLFRSFATACIQENFTRAKYTNNVFIVPVDTIGISVKKTGSDRGNLVIDENRFCGVANASTTAIKFAGNIDAGINMVTRNLLTGTWDVTITATTGAPGCQNFEGSTTGGSLIDCNS